MTEVGQEPEKPLPALRAGIEAVQFEHEGQAMVLLRDQEGLSSESLAVTLPGFVLASMLNGKTTVSEIQGAFAKSTGALLKVEEITGLVAALDKAELLETEAVTRRRGQIHDEFLASSVRPAVHVGGGYPAEPLELAAFLGGFFGHKNGPGKQFPSDPTGAPPQALFAPHIDFHRGGPAYAWAYEALSESRPPDLIVALGVAHASPPAPWTATMKSYETPYGAMGVDAGLYEDFRKTLWYDPVSEEEVHRTEHSLEFQALWLKYLWREKTPKWLPILCSSFEIWADDRPPSSVSTVDEALTKFGKILKARQDRGEKILILAGVDLAHVGPRFGDQIELTPELEKKIQTEDRASIDLALKGNADGFYLSVVQDENWRKVCGLSAIYSALRLMNEMAPSAVGKMLSYGQAPDPMGGIVSFVSAIYPRS